jgi:type IV pilus assembly protein PilB
MEVCQDCGGLLIATADGLECSECGRIYPRARPEDVLMKLGHCNAQDVMSAIVEIHGRQSIDLTDMTIPRSVIDLVPESVARENYVLPLGQDQGCLKIVMSDPSNIDLIEKLQFIFRSDIQPLLAPRAQIIEAINRHYG